MKKILIFIILITFVFSFTVCNLFNKDGNEEPAELPTLAIRNQSSYDLGYVKFSGIEFNVEGAEEPIGPLNVNDLAVYGVK